MRGYGLYTGLRHRFPRHQHGRHGWPGCGKADKGGKVKLTTRIQNYFRKVKRNRIKKRITANPHTLEEVVQWLKREHGAVDVLQQSHSYLEQLMDLETLEREDMEALKVF